MPAPLGTRQTGARPPRGQANPEAVLFRAEPQDNNRLANLCGPLDGNLRQIEDRIGVRITRRDASFLVDGAASAQRRALAVLDRLYRRAGQVLASEEIELVIIEAIDADRQAATRARQAALRAQLPPAADNGPQAASTAADVDTVVANPAHTSDSQQRLHDNANDETDPNGGPVVNPAQVDNGLSATGAQRQRTNRAAGRAGAGDRDRAGEMERPADLAGSGDFAASIVDDALDNRGTRQSDGATADVYLEAAADAATGSGNDDAAITEAEDQDNPTLLLRKAQIQGRTEHQREYLRNVLSHDITFGIGPAGTGKTYLAVACAAAAFERDEVARIVLTRPAVEAGERLGYLPGDLAQKVDPYLRPLYDALYDLMGFDKVTKLFERQSIEIAPLAYMRGRTLNRSFIILDEAQNTTPEQMKMFLTRIGFGSRAVVTGDVTQIDLPKNQQSGLVQAQQILANVRGIAFTRFNSRDVVRHPLVGRIVDAYERHAATTARPADGR